MIPKELEQQMDLGVPEISSKTPYPKLKEFSKQHWPSDAIKRVAADIVGNGKELLVGSSIDWELIGFE